MNSSANPEKAKPGRKVRNPEGETPLTNLADGLVSVGRLVDRLGKQLKAAAPEGTPEALRVVEILEEASLRPEVLALAKSLNKLPPAKWSLVKSLVESNLELFSKTAT